MPVCGLILTLHDRDISQKEKSGSLRSGFGPVRPFYLFCAIIRMFFLTLSGCKDTTVNLCLGNSNQHIFRLPVKMANIAQTGGSN